MKIEFLKARPSAIPIIAKWIHQEWGYIDEYSSFEKLISRYEKTLNTNQIPITWVALDGSKPVGCVSIFDYDVAGGKVLSPWLVALYVDKTYRRKGVGSMLVRHAVKEAKKLGIQKLYLFTGKDYRQKYYEKLGWRVIDTMMYHDEPKVVMSIE